MLVGTKCHLTVVPNDNVEIPMIWWDKILICIWRGKGQGESPMIWWCKILICMRNYRIPVNHKNTQQPYFIFASSAIFRACNRILVTNKLESKGRGRGKGRGNGRGTKCDTSQTKLTIAKEGPLLRFGGIKMCYWESNSVDKSNSLLSITHFHS